MKWPGVIGYRVLIPIYNVQVHSKLFQLYRGDQFY
jgi:hypothetical protein